MTSPVFTVALRDKEGVAKLFRISHASIQDHEQVLALVQDEIPNAPVILVSVN